MIMIMATTTLMIVMGILFIQYLIYFYYILLYFVDLFETIMYNIKLDFDSSSNDCKIRAIEI